MTQIFTDLPHSYSLSVYFNTKLVLICQKLLIIKVIDNLVNLGTSAMAKRRLTQCQTLFMP